MQQVLVSSRADRLYIFLTLRASARARESEIELAATVHYLFDDRHAYAILFSFVSSLFIRISNISDGSTAQFCTLQNADDAATSSYILRCKLNSKLRHAWCNAARNQTNII